MKTLIALSLGILLLSAPALAVYQVGESIAGFTLPAPNGETIDVGGQTVAAFFLIFFATW